MLLMPELNSIEHGTYIDDECIGLMLSKGTYLVPNFDSHEN